MFHIGNFSFDLKIGSRTGINKNKHEPSCLVLIDIACSDPKTSFEKFNG